MNVLMVTTESVPFSKSGGLGDMVGSLSLSLAAKGVKVSVFMPLYSFIDQTSFKKEISFTVPMLGKDEMVETFTYSINGVTFISLSHPYFTNRKGIYGDTSFEPYPDNAARFSLFSKSVVFYLKQSGKNFTHVHSHDWASALVPFYLKKEKVKAKTLFTIHNLAYQGDFSRLDFLLTGDVLSNDLLYGKISNLRLNMMKIGILTADKVTTVSPGYKEEIQTKEFGCSLEEVILSRKKDLYGIINGIDITEWNPETDPFLDIHFDINSLEKKKELKKNVLKSLSLEDETLPLFLMISRIAEQKGYKELLEGEKTLLEEILSLPLNMIIIGTGDANYENKLREIAAKHKNLSLNITFSNSLAHKTEAACDFFFMPSVYEPCGLNQMYSLSYGTIPIAHKTGGLKDTIIDIEENEKNGNGILFSPLAKDAVLNSIKYALNLYKNNDKMRTAVRNALMCDFSWDGPTMSYIELYKQ